MLRKNQKKFKKLRKELKGSNLWRAMNCYTFVEFSLNNKHSGSRFCYQYICNVKKISVISKKRNKFPTHVNCISENVKQVAT